MHRIFVYGTLKRGQPNHYILKNNECGVGKFITTGHTKQAFPLVIAGPFNIPYCVSKEGLGKPVRGEVYDVDDKLLARLDQLEDIQSGHYQRLKKTICLDECATSNETEVEAFVYQLCNYKKFILDLPFHEDYDTYGPHGLPYIPRERRDKTRSYHEIQNV